MPRICLRTGNTLVSTAAAVSLSAAFVFSFNAQAHRLQVSTPAKITVWAWERDEDLSYIEPSKISVAYFAGTIYVRGSSVRFRPRTQKLKLPKAANAFPVFRIESIRGDGHMAAKLGEHSQNSLVPSNEAAGFVAKTIASQVRKLARSGSPVNTELVQVDFDALEDERAFYKSLLRNLRNELSPATKISVTSLASWLLADKWMEPGCADEAVAMLFSIGPGKREVLSLLDKRALNSGAGIPISVGISASEPATNKVLFKSDIRRKIRNLYIFSSRPWTESRLRAITSEALAK